MRKEQPDIILCDFCGKPGEDKRAWMGVLMFTHKWHQVLNSKDWCGECDPRKASLGEKK